MCKFAQKCEIPKFFPLFLSKTLVLRIFTTTYTFIMNFLFVTGFQYVHYRILHLSENAHQNAFCSSEISALVPLPADMNKCIDYMQHSLSIRTMKTVQKTKTFSYPLTFNQFNYHLSTFHSLGFVILGVTQKNQKFPIILVENPMMIVVNF